MFYLLALAVALTTIFGLAHSQSARETLRLQSFYVWSVTAIQQQLQQYELFNVPEQYTNDNETDEFFEVMIDQTEPPKLENNESSESVVEINAAEQSGLIIEEIQQTTNIPSYKRIKEEHDSMLAAINASLQKLSVAANSGKITGAQLYEILVKETQFYDKTLQKRKNDTENESNSITPIIEEVMEVEPTANRSEESQKPNRMYFGESPMDYVPHQD